MKLTNTIRDAFVRAAMADVPKIDYQEKTIKVVMEDAIAQLPPKVRAIYKDKDLTCFVRTDGKYFGNSYVSVPCSKKDFKLTTAAAVKVAEIKESDEAQGENQKELRQKLHAVAYACSTRKALFDMLPEFEKYLPEDDAAACRTLPVVANVVSDFVKAGWPKGAKKPTLKAA
jgi:hypothetical protein